MTRPLEIDDPKIFCRIAVKNGLTTREAFERAIAIGAREGERRSLAKILLDEQILTNKQIQKIHLAVQRYLEKQGVRSKTTKERVQALTGRLVRLFTDGEDDLSTDIEPSTIEVPVIDGAAEAYRELLRKGVAMGASDVHFQGGSFPFVRKDGRLLPLGDQIVDGPTNERALLSFLTGEQRAGFLDRMSIDFALNLPDVARFRASYSRQIDGVDASFRVVPPRIPTLVELGLPAEASIFTTYHQGLVLVTGPAGCGKSTTMAALVQIVNSQKKQHILTVEDPIEVLYPAGRCLVNQRETGRDTRSFERALHAALREDPDVIVIGELRDRETISLALSAAETGHLVFATLHTRNAVRTVDRLVDAFPADKQPQIRSMLAESLRGVVSQHLVPRADGKGRVPAVEILVVTAAIANLIRDNRTFQIKSSIQTGRKQGMRSLEDSLKALVDSGQVSAQEAAAIAENPGAFASS